MRGGALDGDELNPKNRPGIQSVAEQYEVHLNEETAGFVITPNQQELENESISYAPWISKAEWELVHWLGTSQLSQSDIDKFRKLEWVSQVFTFNKWSRDLWGLGPGQPFSS